MLIAVIIILTCITILKFVVVRTLIGNIIAKRRKNEDTYT